LEFWKLSWRDSEDKQKNHHLLTRASKLCFLHKAPSLTSPRCDGWWVHAEGRIETRASEERRKENSMRHYAAARKRERKEAKKMLMEDNNSNNSNKMMKTTATTKKSKKKKEIDVIDNVKYFSCIKDALLSRLDSKERAIWQKEAPCYLRNPEKIRPRRYVFDEEDFVPVFDTTFIVAFEVCRREGQTTLEGYLRVSYLTGMHKKRRFVLIREKDFINRGLPKQCIATAAAADRSGLSREELVRLVRETRARVREKLKPNYEEDGNVDIFFSPYLNSIPPSEVDDATDEGVDIFNGEEFLVVGYYKNEKDHYERKGDEVCCLLPVKLLGLRTGKTFWLSPGHMIRLYRSRRREPTSINSLFNVIDDEYTSGSSDAATTTTTITTTITAATVCAAKKMLEARAGARFGLDLCCGSCQTSMVALEKRRKTLDGKDFVRICVDVDIETHACQAARDDPNVLFVKANVESFNPMHIPPEGIVHDIASAPECLVWSPARRPHNKHRRQQLGDEVANDITLKEREDSRQCVRAIVDVVIYFMVPSFIENPLGTEETSLWNEETAFLGLEPKLEYFMAWISYCKYQYKVRKHTLLLLTFPKCYGRFQSPCTSCTTCPYKRENNKHERRCCYDDCSRRENKVHPRKLVEDIYASFEEFYADMLSKNAR
jgi:hypothetical protein